jgi:hypothetical protein
MHPRIPAIAMTITCLVATTTIGQSTTQSSSEPIPAAFSQLLAQSEHVTSVALTLDTAQGDNGKPTRILLALDNQRRLAFARYVSHDGTTYPARPTSFLYFANGTARASRLNTDMFIETPDVDLWATMPPRAALFAPWPILNFLTQHADQSQRRVFTQDDAGNAALVAPAHGYTITTDPTGTLRTLQQKMPDVTWTLTLADPSPVQVAGIALALPARIIEHEITPTGQTTTTWTVTALDINPADIDQHLAFDAAQLQVNRWDVESGKVLDATGKQVGIEEIPAARAVEVWEQTTKATAWIAVWKWGSIIAGLGLVGFVLDMIRRRL